MQRDTWKRVHGELTRLARSKGAYDAEEARWLLEGKRVRVHEPLGYGSFLSYLEHVFGYGPRMAGERLRVAEALAGLPAMNDALASGELCWSAVRELTRVAVPATEAEWIAAARGKVDARGGGHGVGPAARRPAGRSGRHGREATRAAAGDLGRHAGCVPRGAQAHRARRRALARRRRGHPHAGSLRARRSERHRPGRLSGRHDGVRAVRPRHARRSGPRAGRRAARDRGRVLRRAAHRQHPRGRRARQGHADHPAAHPPPRVPPRTRPLRGARLPRGAISGDPPHRPSSRRAARTIRRCSSCCARPITCRSIAARSVSAARRPITSSFDVSARSGRRRHARARCRAEWAGAACASCRPVRHRGQRRMREPAAACDTGRCLRPPRPCARWVAPPRLLRRGSAAGSRGGVGRRHRDAPARGALAPASAGPRLVRVRTDSALRVAASPRGFLVADFGAGMYGELVIRAGPVGADSRCSIAFGVPRGWVMPAGMIRSRCHCAARLLSVAARLGFCLSLRGSAPGTLCGQRAREAGRGRWSAPAAHSGAPALWRQALCCLHNKFWSPLGTRGRGRHRAAGARLAADIRHGRTSRPRHRAGRTNQVRPRARCCSMVRP